MPDFGYTLFFRVKAILILFYFVQAPCSASLSNEELTKSSPSSSIERNSQL